MFNYEKLGVFYLGREYDLATGQITPNFILYDSKDLVTHAVCVGMTGSGKTGLCISLIEEAAIDGIPSILIDPKGDLPNLLLTFPDLRGQDFEPWINMEDAAKKGMTPAQYAQAQADLWRKGLAEWDQPPERIERLRQSAEFVVYTPGSTAGLPVSILKSFAAPAADVLADSELLQERIQTTVSSLLGLIGMAGDPLQSREHILLANIVHHIWSQGIDLDLASLIQLVQSPPMTRVGVLDLETFYPSKDRFALVLALNNLLASPGFSVWMEGTPLDIDRILYTPAGRPRVAIFSIAHLSDAERMFFVSLLLNQVIGWMRAQPGTHSLRALLYMDEIFGFFPPVANPPSKRPLLTLLKQARAYGLGVVLATQNPVDLDYKGLANAGTWFIGRLQTERDKARVMEGLEGAASTAGAAFDRARIDQILAGLRSRVFLMSNAHEDVPVIFHTRWAMSYLRGPLTRAQIKTLMDPYKAAQAAMSAPPAAAIAPPLTAAAPSAPAPAPIPTATPAGPTIPSSALPAPPPDVQQFFVPASTAGSIPYRPALVGAARLRFEDTRAGISHERAVAFLTPIHDAAIAVDWAEAVELPCDIRELQRSPISGATFAPLPPAAGKAASYTRWNRDFVNWLASSQTLELWRSPSTGALSAPGEDERAFRIRLAQVAREGRDAATEKVRAKYAPKLQTLRERIRRAEQALEREKEQTRQAGLQTAISIGATLLGAFGGRKTALRSNIGRATTAARGAGRAVSQQSDVARAQENLRALQEQLAALDAEFQAELAKVAQKIDPLTEPLEKVVLGPKKTLISVQLVALAWTPATILP